jgi:hypothetical protein
MWYRITTSENANPPKSNLDLAELRRLNPNITGVAPYNNKYSIIMHDGSTIEVSSMEEAKAKIPQAVVINPNAQIMKLSDGKYYTVGSDAALNAMKAYLSKLQTNTSQPIGSTIPQLPPTSPTAGQIDLATRDLNRMPDIRPYGINVDATKANEKWIEDTVDQAVKDGKILDNEKYMFKEQLTTNFNDYRWNPGNVRKLIESYQEHGGRLKKKRRFNLFQSIADMVP